jgi:hypothetical protein
MAPSTPLDRSLLDDPSATQEDLVAALREAEREKNRLAALQAELAVRLDEVVRRCHREELKLPQAQEGRGVASELAIARMESPHRGQRHLGLGKALVTELPHTLAAMTAGVLSEEQATIVARETACLDPDDRRRVDAAIAGRRPDGSYPFTGWGLQRLTGELIRAVADVDAAALVERRARAVEERHVSVRPAPDAMAYFTALLPVERAVAVLAALKRDAASTIAGGDDRSRGQIEADTLVERVTGQRAADQVPVQVQLVISDQTLTGGNHEPAWLAAAGTIADLTAATARDLLTHAAAAGLAALRRVYTDPHGNLVALESTSRCFDGGLAEMINIRDRRCRTPWCDAPIRHKDHITGYAAGGPTSLVNAQGLCETCSYAKEAPGWRSVTATGPPGQPHTVAITTPAGQHLTSSAASLPTADPLLPTLRVDLVYTDPDFQLRYDAA